MSEKECPFELPLRVIGEEGLYQIVDASGKWIENTTRKEEAAFICLVCNSHKDLLDACEGLVEDCELLEQDESISACQCMAKAPDDITEPLPCNYCKAKAAISSAKEGE